tara:strand:- start:156 stop:1721 length:1566 start_codon:yes stop_codon:yes gene_type:complete
MDSSKLTERQIIDYDDKTIDVINSQKGILQHELHIASIEETCQIYENQEKVGKELYQLFKNREVINILVTAMMQSGKTGTMLSFITQYVRRENIPIGNICILTGLSDVEWKNDTTERMPNSLKQRIYHRGMIKKAIKYLKGKKDCVIILDELQIAGQTKQTISKFFKELGYYDLITLLENDIKIVQFSATPDGHIQDIEGWENHSHTIKMEPGEGYTGVKDFMDQERVFQCKELTVIDNVRELFDIVKKFKENRYHLIRVPDKGKGQQLVIDNFKSVFEEQDCEYNDGYLNDKSDFNELLSEEPNKHTFVFYCQKARCAKTFQVKKYIGISYERFAKKFNDSTILQSSIGRLCGYNDNGDSICYTNITSCENYIKLWENDLSYEGVEWNTSTTKYDKNEKCTKSKEKSFNHAKNIDGIDIYEEVNTDIKENYKYELSDDKKELQVFFKNKFPDGGCPQGTKEKDGEYNWQGQKITKERLQYDIDNGKLSRYNTGQGKSSNFNRYLLAYYDGDIVKWCLIYK